SGGDHSTPPRYHVRRLAYSGELGVAVRNRLGLESNSLAVLECNKACLALTWLGQLLNLCLVSSVKSLGGFAAERSFGLILTNTKPEQILSVLRSAIDALSRHNPLGDLPIEGFTDLGSHFDELTDEGQRRA